jgi:ABC-type Mn2+/Zn2+ transport system ATPase subunit
LDGTDKPIKKRISGGEKSRLILAGLAYKIIQKDVQFIVLDEPLPDVHPDQYAPIIRWFFNLFHDRTIVFIGHLRSDDRKALDISWTRQLVIKNNYLYSV